MFRHIRFEDELPKNPQPPGLAKLIAEASAAGFEAVRMATQDKPFGYRVTFQRQAEPLAASGDGQKV